MSFYKLSGAALAALLLLATPALAHAELKTAIPAVDSTAPAPTDLRLNFSEDLELAFTKVELTGANGAAIATGPLALDPADPTALIVPLTTPLPDGAVQVHWKAVAADGHKSEGSYSFTVAP